MEVFYRIGGNCWIHTTKPNNQTSESIKQFNPLHNKLGKCIELSGQQLQSAAPSLPIDFKKTYAVYQTDSIAALEPVTRNTLGIWPAKVNSQLQLQAELITEKYRRQKWQSFLDAIYNGSTTEQVLLAGMNHTLCDHYSLWLYNEQAEKFHLHSSSFKSDRSSIDLNDRTNSLTKFIDSGKAWEFLNPSFGNINYEALKGMKSINRFKIDVGFPAVLSYYSAIENYSFSNKARKLIPEILQSKLHEEIFPQYVKKSLKLKDITSHYELGKFREFLDDVLLQVTRDLGWEAASVFLYDGERKSLTLRAIASNSQAGNLPQTLPEYPIGCTSLTSTVFTENRPSTIYDVTNHKQNSHRYDEPTKSLPRNWVGIPIGRAHQQPIGVLRTKNRTENSCLVDPNVLDIKLLEAIASNIAYLHDLNSLYEQRRINIQESLNDVSEENRNLNEFIKTFRHELKSPLTILTQASNTIRIKLVQENLIPKAAPLPRKLQLALDDLDAVGSRLALVTNYLTFDAHELVRDIARSRVYKEIVAPVTTFAAGYAKARGRHLDTSVDTLARYSAICDPGAAAMAFHMILDNAIKYSDEESVIHIYGNIKNEYIGIRVASNSLTIREDEAQSIFEKYFRGEEARSQKIEGSGIGLFLARQIMILNGGDIVLVKRSNPVTFEIRLKSLNI